MRRPVLIAGGVTIVAAAVFGVQALRRDAPEVRDYRGPGHGTVVVEVRRGASAQEIGEILAKAGVVGSTEAFVAEVVARSKEGSLQPGWYRMRREMAAASALDLMLSPASRVVRTVTVPEGKRLSEVLTLLASATGLPLREFTDAVARPDALGLPGYAKGTVEGFLFPATYELEPAMPARELLRRMVAEFKRTAERLRLTELAGRHGLTPFEVVIAASIVQAEGGRDPDFPKIARVIYNRLGRGAKLEMDSTVNYALGRHTLKVSEQDTKVASPYNTYLHPGLPPGPICNPGERALEAMLHPADGDWYWFVTTDPERKITKFTDKETEFRKYREELNRYLRGN